jgi:cation-transporting ATPase I
VRVLLVAEGTAATDIAHPTDLTALGFIGLSDPLRPSARQAVRICHDAGIRVIMLTGDHPATARAIATEAGLLRPGDEVLTGSELAELQNGELSERLERTAVIARATPVDKLRIIETLQRSQHVVAMTGDGVNDAPALRLADVGVAMGLGGTEVARQTADVVLLDDNFATLVEGLVEGRSFWGNMRRALGLLIGGNLGELVLVVGASVLGIGTALNARQVLGVNFVTDVLPGLAVALQQPAQRQLAGLAREGASALEGPLRNDILRRTGTTGGISLAAYLAALATGGPAQATSVGFASIVATQLAQTLDASRTADGVNVPITASVLASVGLLVVGLTVPPLRAFLQLALPSPLSLALIGGAVAASTTLNRLLMAPAMLPVRQPRLHVAPAT